MFKRLQIKKSTSYKLVTFRDCRPGKPCGPGDGFRSYPPVQHWKEFLKNLMAAKFNGGADPKELVFKGLFKTMINLAIIRVFWQ